MTINITTFTPGTVASSTEVNTNFGNLKTAAETLDTTVTGLDAANVKLTGNQTIYGLKGFVVSPIAPTPISTDNPLSVATKKYVDDTALSLGNRSARPNSVDTTESTDGFVFGSGHGIDAWIGGIPVLHTGGGEETNYYQSAFCFPVKAGVIWRVNGITIYYLGFTPMA